MEPMPQRRPSLMKMLIMLADDEDEVLLVYQYYVYAGAAV